MRVLAFMFVFVALSGHSLAQQFVCTSIHSNDTAAGLALRLTNSSDNRHQPWFQILDPRTGRFIPKTAYDLIFPEWRVCLTSDVAAARASTAVVASTRAPARSDRLTPMRFLYRGMIVLALLAPLLAFPAVKREFDKRSAVLDRMTAFSVTFIREFARPLPRRHPEDRPITARVRCAAFRARLDILLAPTPGHTYPNLSDHRKNLVYDIERVLRRVPHHPFVPGEPYSRGDWVVIPFHVKHGGS